MPFWEETSAAQLVAEMPGRLHHDYEVRIFMPKYGLIDDRRWRLHEVKRLSGITIRVGTLDYSLNVKVASIPGTRTQVYFLDNHEFWARKGTFCEPQSQTPYPDNDERIIFFSKGVIQVLKKLSWYPQVIHCNGWMTGLLAVYIRHLLRGDPQLGKAHLVFTNYMAVPGARFSKAFPEKAKWDNHIPEVFAGMAGGPYETLLRVGQACAEVIEGEPSVDMWSNAYTQLLAHSPAQAG
jgi:starch synthase